MNTYKENIGLINKYSVPTLINWLEKRGIPYDCCPLENHGVVRKAST